MMEDFFELFQDLIADIETNPTGSSHADCFRETQIAEPKTSLNTAIREVIDNGKHETGNKKICP